MYVCVSGVCVRAWVCVYVRVSGVCVRVSGACVHGCVCVCLGIQVHYQVRTPWIVLWQLCPNVASACLVMQERQQARQLGLGLWVWVCVRTQCVCVQCVHSVVVVCVETNEHFN